MGKILRKKKKEKRVVINDRGETLPESGVERIKMLATEVANKAKRVGAEIYPEDVILLHLATENAFKASDAIKLPEKYRAKIYTLWVEDFVAHSSGDKIYLTAKGKTIVGILLDKLKGGNSWKEQL